MAAGPRVVYEYDDRGDPPDHAVGPPASTALPSPIRPLRDKNFVCSPEGSSGKPTWDAMKKRNQCRLLTVLVIALWTAASAVKFCRATRWQT